MIAKKLFSLFLVAILLLHLAGFYIYFVVRLGEIRMNQREALAHLPVEQLEAIVMPRASFRAAWMEEREMEWQDRMYDIGRVEASGEWITVYGLEDKDEENLLSMLSAVVRMSTQDTSSAPTSVTQFFSLEYLVGQVDQPNPPPPHNAVSQRSLYLFFAPEVDLLPVTPPPRS
ncbi:MAG: hypothetical protein JNK10_09860 [Cyclobacteriaceae bacterium]|nr:hypothetical protein [Cyclobacteriaceae bacterium]